MRLYDFAPAPSPRRVRIFLAEKGIEIPTEQVNLREREQFDDAFLGLNPLGFVPVLELDDGTHICESVAICRYFETLQPDPPLMGQDPTEQALVEMWNRRMELDGFLAVVEALRNAHPAFADRALPGLTNHPQIPELAERGRKRIDIFFSVLEEILEGRPYVAGDHFSIADITALVTVDFARRVDMQLPDTLEHTHRWYQRVSERPSARA